MFVIFLHTDHVTFQSQYLSFQNPLLVSMFHIDVANVLVFNTKSSVCRLVVCKLKHINITYCSMFTVLLNLNVLFGLKICPPKFSIFSLQLLIKHLQTI